MRLLGVTLWHRKPVWVIRGSDGLATFHITWNPWRAYRRARYIENDEQGRRT